MIVDPLGVRPGSATKAKPAKAGDAKSSRLPPVPTTSGRAMPVGPPITSQRPHTMDRTRHGLAAVATLAAMTILGTNSVAQTGNGAPSGPHYNLNIIGVPKDLSPNFNGGNGGRIFVPLSGSTRINLTMGDFQVLDADGTDGTAAFQLPNPDDGSGNLTYSVWVRALGKPGGSASMTSCFTETLTNTTWCNSGTLVVGLNRLGGGQKFVDVSKQLLQVCANVSTNPLVTVLDLVPLFSSLGTDYFWQYDNTGLKLTQMRFYPISTKP